MVPAISRRKIYGAKPHFFSVTNGTCSLIRTEATAESSTRSFSFLKYPAATHLLLESGREKREYRTSDRASSPPCCESPKSSIGLLCTRGPGPASQCSGRFH